MPELSLCFMFTHIENQVPVGMKLSADKRPVKHMPVWLAGLDMESITYPKGSHSHFWISNAIIDRGITNLLEN